MRPAFSIVGPGKLVVSGANSFVADANDLTHNSALTGLTSVAGDFELRFADAQPRPIGQLHDRNALDGDVLAQDAWLDGHAALRQLVDRLSIQNADLAQWTPGVTIALQPIVGYQMAFRPGYLTKLFFRVGVDRNEAGHCTQ